MEEHFHFKKKYGQNFLKDRNLVDKIARSAQIEENSLVIEVGPGAGILTRQLAKYADQVICFEIDTDLKEVLAKNLQGYDNIYIYYEDFLKVDVMNYLSQFSYKHLYFVSNVPYYITTPILMKLMELPVKFSNIVMMVQKEVGNRFCSVPGSREYGSISVYLNYFFTPRKLFEVSRYNFVPVPKVDSVIVSLVPRKSPFIVKDLPFFFQLVRDSFQFKRKTLRNNLKNYDLQTIELLLKEHGYTLNVRAEELSVEIFVKMSNALTSGSFGED